MRNYYCSDKFEWLLIRLYDGFVSSCCQAIPDRLRIADLDKDPAAFFNWPQIMQERQQMLHNQRVAGCEVCWKQEDKGLVSRHQSREQRHYSDIRAKPRILNIVVSNTCNMTCSYCCKTFSHSWLKDVIENGDYPLDIANRYKANDQEKVLHRISQKAMGQSGYHDRILHQIIANSQNLESLIITGGETFLYNDLVGLINSLPDVDIDIYTGLGVNPKRLEKILQDLSPEKKLRFKISAENIDRLHEFNRYGSSWEEFKQNVSILSKNFPCVFDSRISNLTIFGLPDFLEYWCDYPCEIDLVLEPSFMQVQNLDHDSKLAIKSRLQSVHHPDLEKILQQLDQPAYDEHIHQNALFLKRFVSVRKLDINVFPASFIRWLNL